MAKEMTNRQYSSNADALNLYALPLTHVLKNLSTCHLPPSLATSGSKDIPSLLMGTVSPSHSKEKPTCSESQETKCSPGELALRAVAG